MAITMSQRNYWKQKKLIRDDSLWSGGNANRSWGDEKGMEIERVVRLVNTNFSSNEIIPINHQENEKDTVKDLLEIAAKKHQKQLEESTKERKEDKAHIAYLKGFIKGMESKRL